MAVVLVAFAGAFIIAPVDDADATGTIGNYDFYLISSTNPVTVEKYEATGFNASDALNSQSTLLTAMDSTVDNAFSKQYHNDYGDYTSVNTAWGAITKNAGSAVAGHQWNVFVYTLDGVDGAGQWKVADMTLGFYKPFDDYNSAYATANVALYYGEELTSVPALPTTNLQTLTHVATGDSAFKITFEYYYEEGGESYYDMIDGYGSDAAIALINAVGAANVSLSMTPGVSYGYVNSLFGKATDDSTGTWLWWQMMNDSKTSTQLVESQFYLGFYTPVPGFELSCNNISLTYGDGSLFQ